MSQNQPQGARVATLYNPQNLNKTQLVESFVVRQKLFEKLYKSIKESKMETPEQHYLILGRRGMGKTTLMLRLAIEIENDPDLNNWLIPVVFNEEEYRMRRLYNLWERVMEILNSKNLAFNFSVEEKKGLSEQFKNDDTYERALFEWLMKELKSQGKKIILFMDNFGDFAQKLKDEEAHRLRKILQTEADIRFFAASSVILDSVYEYKYPFYEFFKEVELKGLDREETHELLLKLSEHYKKDAVARILQNNPARIETLRSISGGVIRTMVMLFEIFADDENGTAFKDLEAILDRVTPLYKHRMDDLSPQQQAIVEAIALNWDALYAKEIAELTRMESKAVSAQLQLLEKSGIVEKRITKTKNHLYLISERFFNIWYLMRNGSRHDQNRVLWLVRFFEEWYDEKGLKERIEQHRKALNKGDFDPEAASVYSSALAIALKNSFVEQHLLLMDTKLFLKDKEPILTIELTQSDIEKAFHGVQLYMNGEEQEGYEILTSFLYGSGFSGSVENLSSRLIIVFISSLTIYLAFTIDVELYKFEIQVIKDWLIRLLNEMLNGLQSSLKDQGELLIGVWIAFYFLKEVENDKILFLFDALLKVESENLEVFFAILALCAPEIVLNLFKSNLGKSMDLGNKHKVSYYSALKKLNHPDSQRMGEELEVPVSERIEVGLTLEAAIIERFPQVSKLQTKA